MINLRLMQKQMSDWAFDNFGRYPTYHNLLGISEEVGELCHVHLKAEQEIRDAHNNTRVKKIDAIGDIVIHLCNYCQREGIDLEEAILNTWSEVRRRNWKKFPKNGLTE